MIVIGGAEDKVRDRLILGRFVALAGGLDATVVVISSASSLGAEAAVPGPLLEVLVDDHAREHAEARGERGHPVLRGPA